MGQAPRTRGGRALGRAALVLGSLVVAPPLAAEPPAAPVVMAPGWAPLAYPPPVPGSYSLPPLGPAADGDVLDTTGRRRRLHDFMGDKIVVLSFIYTHCPDVNACPLASYVMSGVGKRLGTDPAVGTHVRLLTMSFDPANDDPATMDRYGRHLVRGDADWRFLAPASAASLAPILAAYDQAVQVATDEAGEPLGTMSHVLRIYLIDRAKRIRNVYSTAFLHVDALWSDVQTLLAEESDGARVTPVAASGAVATGLHGAGDDKRGYERPDYETRSRSLPRRRGASADLVAQYGTPPRGLPPVPASPDNPVTPAKVALGRKLFFDRRLSRNDTISCAMCHVPEQGFTSNEITTAVGIEGRSVRRNAPTIYNVGHARLLFHDGREDRLEQQVWAPLLAANEMGNPSIGYVLTKLRALNDYAGLFEAAFDGRGPGMETVGRALASYERTLVSANSPFDRWRFGAEPDALGPVAARGFALFTGKARCAACHLVSDDAALFTDHGLHNTGIGFRRSMAPTSVPTRVQIAPGTFVQMAPEAVRASAEAAPNDVGRYEVTEDPADRWKYKTPTLRNVALTAPYMHDGSIATLGDVVRFYDGGGVPNDELDARIRPLGLTDAEVDALVAFLESLVGDNVDLLIADAFAAPVGDPG